VEALSVERERVDFFPVIKPVVGVVHSEKNLATTIWGGRCGMWGRREWGVRAGVELELPEIFFHPTRLDWIGARVPAGRRFG
jgi:hypothetical protein